MDDVVPTRDVLHNDGSLYERSVFVGGERHGSTVRYYVGLRPGTTTPRILERGEYCNGTPCGVWEAWDPEGQPLPPRDYGERGAPLVPFEALDLEVNSEPRDKYEARSWLESHHHSEVSQALRRRWDEYKPQLKPLTRAAMQEPKGYHHPLIGQRGSLARANANQPLNRLREELASEAIAALRSKAAVSDPERSAHVAVIIDGLSTLTHDRDMLALVELIVEAPEIFDDNQRHWFIRLTASHPKFATANAPVIEAAFVTLLSVLESPQATNASRAQAKALAVMLAPTLARHTTDPERVDAFVVRLAAALPAEAAYIAPLHAARGGMHAKAGNHTAAVAAYEAAVELWTPLGYDVRIAKVLPSLVASLKQIGAHRRAQAAIDRALTLPNPPCINADGTLCQPVESNPTFD